MLDAIQIVNTIRAGFIPALCCLLCVVSAKGQSTAGQEPIPPPQRDSVFTERQIQNDDSLAVPLPQLGRLSAFPDEALVDISKADRRFVQYRSASELLSRGSHLMPISHGGNAQHNTVSIAGGLNADIATSFNGRPMVDPWNDAFHLMQIAPEGLERIEILTGTDAVGLGGSMSLAAMNLQEIRHNSATPYTSLWYSQGGGELIAVDGTFSQNVARGLNITFGVRRSGTAEPRYTNTGFDVWNVRAAVRYTATDRTHLSVSYNLASLNTGLWGGLRTGFDLDSLTERTAPPVFFNLQDESRRHDLTATIVHLFDADTTFTVTGQVFASVNNVLRLRDTTLRTSITDTVDNFVVNGSQYGVLARADYRLGATRLRVGVGADYLGANQSVYTQEVDEVRPQVFGHIRIPLSSSLSFSGAGRVEQRHTNTLVGVGAALTLSVGDESWIKADLSTAQRAPTAGEGFSLSPERHILATLTSRWVAPSITFEGQAFYRLVSDRLLTTSDRDADQFIRSTSTFNGPNASVAGVTAQANFTSTWFELRPIVRAFVTQSNGIADDRFPGFMAELYAAGVYRLGSNSVRLGVRGLIQTGMMGQQYVPTTSTYTTPVGRQDIVNNGLDLFLTAILGNASIRFSYENLLASRWYIVAVAPEIISDIRLSVTWSFFD